MAYLNDLDQVQIGWESVWGTAVAGTAKVMGVTDCKIQPIDESILHTDGRGSLAPGYVVSKAKIGAQGQLNQEASYEDVHYPIEMMFGTVSPSGTSAPYTRDYAAPLAAASTPRKATLIKGQTGKIQHIRGAIGSKLVLSGGSNAPVTAALDIIGQQAGTGTLASLSDRTVNMVMGDHASLYIDAWAGTLGSTAIATLAWSWELTIDAKRQLRWLLGAQTPGDYNERKWEGTLKLSLEVGTASLAYLTSSIAAATPLQQQVRIKNTTGSGATEKLLQIDFCGTALAVPEIVDRDGVATFDWTLSGTYHSTVANWLKIQTKCGSATIV